MAPLLHQKLQVILPRKSNFWERRSLTSNLYLPQSRFQQLDLGISGTGELDTLGPRKVGLECVHAHEDLTALLYRLECRVWEMLSQVSTRGTASHTRARTHTQTDVHSHTYNHT